MVLRSRSWLFFRRFRLAVCAAGVCSNGLQRDRNYRIAAAARQSLAPPAGIARRSHNSLRSMCAVLFPKFEFGFPSFVVSVE